MSLYRQLLSSRCSNPCEVTCPQPYADAWNEPCVTSCGDSRAVVYPPPVVVTFPGPILSSCPQESFVGSSAPISIGSSFGDGSSFTYGGSLGYGGSCSLGSTYPCYSQRVNRYRYRSCGPCQTQKEFTCTRNTQETKCKIQAQELADDCEKC